MAHGMSITADEEVPEGQIWFIGTDGTVLVKIVELDTIKPDDSAKSFLKTAHEILERHSH